MCLCVCVFFSPQFLNYNITFVIHFVKLLTIGDFVNIFARSAKPNQNDQQICNVHFNSMNNLPSVPPTILLKHLTFFQVLFNLMLEKWLFFNIRAASVCKYVKFDRTKMRVQLSFYWKH